VILLGFRNDDLKPLTGKTLAEVAALRGTSPEETIVDLVIEDDSRVATAYFIMSEDNIAKKIRQPWMAFGSDAESLAPEGVFLQSNPHPRTYGNFARLLGKYVRDEKVVSLPEAIRRLTSFPADNLGLAGRGRLQPGHYADIAVFDPATISDHATFTEPHRYATGVRHVLVNGVPVLKDGEHTVAMPGRFVRGPGAREQAASPSAAGPGGR
jgi:N-acyl-D-amino-acid deacylase